MEGDREHNYMFTTIWLCCATDIIHGHMATEESWAIKVVCRRLGYADLKPDHEKAVRSFANNQDMFVSTINCQRKVLMPVRLLQGRWQTSFFALHSEPLEEDNLCNEMSHDGIIVCQSSSTLCYVLHPYITIFATAGNEKLWNRVLPGAPGVPLTSSPTWWKLRMSPL